MCISDTAYECHRSPAPQNKSVFFILLQPSYYNQAVAKTFLLQKIWLFLKNIYSPTEMNVVA